METQFDNYSFLIVQAPASLYKDKLVFIVNGSTKGQGRTYPFKPAGFYYSDGSTWTFKGATSTGGTGTVTSVDITTNAPAITITGNPITTAGTIDLGFNGATTDYIDGTGDLQVFPSIPSVTPAALTKVDDSNVTLTLGGAPATALLQATSLTLGWSGQLPITRGGTGLGTLGTALQQLRVNAGATALEYFTPSAGSGLTIGTTPITSGTVGRVLFEGSGNVLQENAILNLDTTNGLIIGGATARGTRLTIVNSSDSAAVQNLVIRNAADSANRLIIYGDGNIKSLPSNVDFNASNELQIHVENTAALADNVGVSFKNVNTQGFLFANRGDTAIKLGQVVSGVVQPVLSFRYNNDFRAATIRGTTSVSLSVGLTIVNVSPNREWGILVGNTSNAILGTGGLGLLDVTGGNFGLTINGSTNNVGIGPILATARLHIRAGSATASTAPLKFTTGTILTTAEAGAMEYNNTFHLTNSDATRRHIVLSAANAKTVGVVVVDGFITMNIGGNNIKIATVT
jgi:hypothetical protein